MNEPSPRVGLHLRLGAIFYDSMLLLALLFLASVPPTLLHGGAMEGQWWYRLYLLLIAYLFFAGFWHHGGQTLGMRAWRIRLVDGQGSSPGWGACTIRFALALLGWLPLGLGYWWALWDRDSLSWHDRGSATRLVRVARSR